jgi:hypothetical protein
MTVDEGKLLAAAAKGNAADQELRMLGEAFNELRKELKGLWERSLAADTAGRENLWLATRLTTQIEELLRGYVSNGKIATQQIDAIRQAGEAAGAKRRHRRA